jgi:dipeptidyl aminopeptidase/acylaminoacyl peptidase
VQAPPSWRSANEIRGIVDVSVRTPSGIMHGDQDKTVPYTQGNAMYDALTKAGVASKLLTVDCAGHGFFGPNAKRVNLEMVAWFEKYLQ